MFWICRPPDLFIFIFFFFQIKERIGVQARDEKDKQTRNQKKITEQPTNIPHVYIIFVVFFHLPIIHTILYYMQHWTRRGNSCFINYLVHILAWYCKLYTIEISEGIWGIIFFCLFVWKRYTCLFMGFNATNRTLVLFN